MTDVRSMSCQNRHLQKNTISTVAPVLQTQFSEYEENIIKTKRFALDSYVIILKIYNIYLLAKTIIGNEESKVILILDLSKTTSKLIAYFGLVSKQL